MHVHAGADAISTELLPEPGANHLLAGIQEGTVLRVKCENPGRSQKGRGHVVW